MGLRNTHKTNEDLENNGVWIEVDVNDHNGEPMKIKIGAMSKANKNYSKRLDAILKPHQAAIQNDTLPEALGERLMRSLFAETILFDWDNFPLSEWTGKEEDTDIVPYSREKAIELWAMPEFGSKVFDHWHDLAKKSSNFREALMDNAAKN